MADYDDDNDYEEEFQEADEPDNFDDDLEQVNEQEQIDVLPAGKMNFFFFKKMIKIPSNRREGIIFLISILFPYNWFLLKRVSTIKKGNRVVVDQVGFIKFEMLSISRWSYKKLQASKNIPWFVVY